MKNLFLCLLISVSSVVAFAFDEKAAAFNEKGFEMLYKNIENIKLEGDVRPNEKINLIGDAAEFYAHSLGSIMSLGDDVDSEDVKLFEFAPNCKVIDKSMKLGECMLHFNYKSGEKVTVNYLVELNDNMPVRVFLNKR